MNVWKSESNTPAQTALMIGCVLVGLLFVWLTHTSMSVDPNAKTGFFLGLLLLGIGVMGFFSGGKQTIEVNPKTRTITVRDQTWFWGEKIRRIRFDEISDISLSYLGRRSNMTGFYYLELALKNGQRYPLFSPGRFFEGISERNVVQSWRSRLWSYIQA